MRSCCLQNGLKGKEKLRQQVNPCLRESKKRFRYGASTRQSPTDKVLVAGIEGFMKKLEFLAEGFMKNLQPPCIHDFGCILN